MGYTTDFDGSFELNKPLDKETLVFLTKLAQTRRMKRDMPGKYGVDGEFFVDGKGDYGQADDASVVSHNEPPSTQPGLWCQWVPNEEGTEIEWDGGEKFYFYVEWLQYIVTKILKPRGYSINGVIRWRGEEFDDIGKIEVDNNEIDVITGTI